MTNAFDKVKFGPNFTLRASQEFKRDKTVFIERPCLFLPCKVMNYCGFCSKKIDFQFFPCRGCNDTVFCNKYCEEMAWRESHSNTCRFNYRVASRLSVECSFAYHLLARLPLADVAQVLSQQKSEMNDTRNWHWIMLTYMFTHNRKSIYYPSSLKAIILMQAFELALIAIHKFHNVEVFHQDQNKFICLVEGLFYLMCNLYKSPFIRKKMKWRVKSKPYGDQLAIVRNLYACGVFENRLMHSCMPNLYRRYKPSGLIVYKATRDIHPDELLTISFGVNLRKDRAKRRSYLNKYYGIDPVCACDLCNMESGTGTHSGPSTSAPPPPHGAQHPSTSTAH